MSTSSNNGLSLLAASTPAKSSNTVDHKKEQNKSFTSPSFLSPEPASTTQKPQNKLTLSGQPTRKIKPVKRPLGAYQGLSTPSTQPKTLDKKLKKLSHKDRSLKLKKSSHQVRAGLSKSARVLEDISNRRNTEKQLDKTGESSTILSHDPTRKLEFPTPIKHSEKKKELKPVESSSSSSSSSSEDEGYSSDEAEVTFDAATIGNMRVVRESLSQSPALSTVSSSSGMPPLGLEYQFSVSSTVSSVAVAPNGKFLVVGFYNGMVYLYPLTKDSLIFRRGVLLDQIMPRGMYTQIMVTVAIPDDGKFIFAGVYRGSTDIRAFEVDSITLPSPTDLPESTKASSLLTTSDSDNSEDEDTAGAFGLPTAKVITHTYSDAKLKGFAAAKSLYHKGSKKTEYRLLCGIGIKNVHMWRFYHQKTESGGFEWNWECVFDKQTNGISLEFITFHPTIANQFISKSEHQNVRIWHLEEEYDASDDSVTIRKKSHTDVKQTVDTVAVYGDYAYGGSESLAVVDLQSATRMDLDLPLSAKEQHAQREALLNSRNANSLRAWNPRGSRRRGAEDTSGQRHMRTVNKVAGQDASPFTVGMCSDGSVFFHQPRKETGMATPLDYIEGYEQFFVDPSLDFQAQFSDLTRVNTSGLLAVLPLPETEKEKWMVVAANQDQILVRSLEAFLHRNQQKKEYSQVKSDLRNVMRDLGGAESSSDESDSSSDPDVEDKNVTKEKHQRTKKLDKTFHKRSRQETSSKSQEAGRKVKRSRQESEKVTSSKSSVESGEKRKVLSACKNGLQKKFTNPKTDDQNKVNDSMVAVTTPKRSKLSMSTASPVVSISSSSGSSNPNTPEQPGLSRVERQLLALKELQWTPPPATASKSQPNNQEELTDSAVDAAAVLAQLSSSRNQVESKTKNASNGKKTTHRMKAQALFTDIEDNVDKENGEVAKKESKETETTSSSTKKAVAAKVSNKRGRKKSPRAEAEKQVAVAKEPEKVAEDNQVEAAQLVEEEQDAELDEELEQLEQYEHEFVSVPLVSDKGSLLAATMYQYAGPGASSGDITMANTDEDIENDRSVAATEQANLLMQFSRQNERLKMNFLAERERIYKHPDCSCASHSHSKKSSSSTGGVNWRRNVAHDYLKRKQLKRRHKKQLASKLQQLHASYTVQVQELYAMQQMEANAFRARQEFQHLHKQFRGQTSKTDSAPSSPSTVAIKHSVMPDHLSGANFPYPDLLS